MFRIFSQIDNFDQPQIIVCYSSAPNGFVRRINFGIKVSEPSNASIIAIPVSIPKCIEGTKLEKVRMEKPMIIVIEEINNACPIVV